MRKLLAALAQRGGAALFIGCAVIATVLMTALTHFMIALYPDYVLVVVMSGVLAVIYAAIYHEYCYWLKQQSQEPSKRRDG